MENPFFAALEWQGFKASELAEQTNKVLVPFKHYLDNSIKALQNKEVSCEWRPVANKRYELTPDKRIWWLEPVSEILIKNNNEGWFRILSVDGKLPDSEFDPDERDALFQGKGKGRRETVIPESGYNAKKYELFLPELILDDEPVSWSGYQLKLRPLTAQLDSLKTVYIDGQECAIEKTNESHLTLKGHVKANSKLSIDGQNMSFTLLKGLDESRLKQWEGKAESNGWLLFSASRPELDGCAIQDVTSQELVKLSCGHFQAKEQSLQSDQWMLKVEGSNNKKGKKKNGDTLILESLADQSLERSEILKCSAFPQLNWTIEPAKVEEKWIQLIEKDGSEDTGRSDLDYFFGDNQHIKILDTKNNKDEGFRILKERQEERQLLLARNSRGKKNRNSNSEYPSIHSKTCEIRVSVDTNQLKRQREAINQLMKRPAAGLWPLIQVLQQRNRVCWPDVEPVKIPESDWKVLTDPNFDGCDRQREFVTKAMANNDFTILDGPPGTGKTTTILELIIQLVLQGKRVLLSASTHAAINNVLERIKEDTVLSKHIFPLRIGDESNAIGVEKFQFDKLFDEMKKANGFENLTKQMVVDSSNLVCGTTIGILRLFNDREISLDTGEPPFDVMIIDECSKTTFQEFLVPARYAKRWVLVGDVRQLSPFTDREQIVANLDNLMLVPAKGKFAAKTLSPSVQQACFLLEELRGNHQSPYSQPMLVPVTRDVANALVAEIAARYSTPTLAKGLNKLLIVMANACRDADGHQVELQQIKRNPEQLYRYNLYFVEESCLDELCRMIPNDMLVLHPDWYRTSQASQHRASGTDCKPFRVKTTDYSDTVKVYKELLDRINSTKWSEEVCWRLEREYWLRLSKNREKKTGYLENTLERLFPKSVSADGRIHVLKNIAFPSILEALSGDGLVKRKNEDPTTLNQGFRSSEKQQRYTTLTYQHRMHPDISAFPSQQFYPSGVLSNGNNTTHARKWHFDRYPARNIWLDVKGETRRGNSNQQEVTALIAELKAFCDWAEGKSKNQKEESFDVAILTFYKGQEKALRNALQKLPSNVNNNANSYARFNYKGISIKLATVDYFQGQEADVVFLSMVNTHRDGFMDSPNRLNVAVTRARYQLVVVGHHQYFSEGSRTVELNQLAKSCKLISAGNPKSPNQIGMQKRRSIQ